MKSCSCTHQLPDKVECQDKQRVAMLHHRLPSPALVSTAGVHLIVVGGKREKN
jgi:hypothetical protein